MEQIANGAIKMLANKHNLLDPEINDHDKYMTYDGKISGFIKEGKDYKKADWDFSVPIQVKGHRDKDNKRRSKYINKGVDLADLRIYYNSQGVVYFQVFMDEDGGNEEIFYALLTQSKAKYYLDRAEKKNKKTSTSVLFTKLQKKPEELYRILKQFSFDSQKQNKQLADNTIPLTDLRKVKELSVTVFDAKNEIDVMKRVANGDACLFGKIQGNLCDIPIEWRNDMKVAVFKKRQMPISIGGEVLYDNYRVKVTSDDEFLVYPSDNIEINLTSSKYRMTWKTTLKKAYTDARFLLALLDNTEFTIAGHSFAYTNPQMDDDFKLHLQFVVDLYEVFLMIGFDTEISLESLSEKDLEDLCLLVSFKRGQYNRLLTSELNRYQWHYRNKSVPLLIIKWDNPAQEIEIADAVYSPKFQTYATLKNNDDIKYITPLFIYHEAETISNLYKYDYDFFYSQIDKADINEYTIDYLNGEVLKLIKVYDINGDEHFLQIAEYLAKKIENVQHQPMYEMNLLQIKKRMGLWGEEEIAELDEITLDSPQVLFGKYVLLDNRSEADKCFGLMSPDEQETYKGYPIYTLYKSMEA